MAVRDSITSKLTAAFAPTELEIIDESHLHAGHVGARPGGETHFRVRITAAAFAGQSRVDRQRQVYAVLADEMKGGVHALALATTAPGERSLVRR
ncbi:MAG: BolA family transcriptional regulator [Alphaproteobacteria bacterium]|nr:BolA family transcriptional regulator [Alphaproteobacteria bacterium]